MDAGAIPAQALRLEMLNDLPPAQSADELAKLVLFAARQQLPAGLTDDFFTRVTKDARGGGVPCGDGAIDRALKIASLEYSTMPASWLGRAGGLARSGLAVLATDVVGRDTVRRLRSNGRMRSNEERPSSRFAEVVWEAGRMSAQ